MNIRIIQILLFLVFCQSGCSVATEEYPFEPETVELKGFLEKELKYGPPNYGENPEVDQKLTVYVLNLKKPITVGTQATLSELNDEFVTDVMKVQVVFLAKSVPDEIKTGEFVVLRGSLSKQVSSHDFYPIIFRISK